VASGVAWAPLSLLAADQQQRGYARQVGGTSSRGRLDSNAMARGDDAEAVREGDEVSVEQSRSREDLADDAVPETSSPAPAEEQHFETGPDVAQASRRAIEELRSHIDSRDYVASWRALVALPFAARPLLSIDQIGPLMQMLWQHAEVCTSADAGPLGAEDAAALEEAAERTLFLLNSAAEVSRRGIGKPLSVAEVDDVFRRLCRLITERDGIKPKSLSVVSAAFVSVCKLTGYRQETFLPFAIVLTSPATELSEIVLAAAGDLEREMALSNPERETLGIARSSLAALRKHWDQAVLQKAKLSPGLVGMLVHAHRQAGLVTMGLDIARRAEEVLGIQLLATSSSRKKNPSSIALAVSAAAERGLPGKRAEAAARELSRLLKRQGVRSAETSVKGALQQQNRLEPAALDSLLVAIADDVGPEKCIEFVEAMADAADAKRTASANPAATAITANATATTALARLDQDLSLIASSSLTGPEAGTYNLLISMVGKKKDPERAMTVFERMRERGIPPDENTAPALIWAAARRGEGESLDLVAERAQIAMDILKEKEAPLTVMAFNALANAYARAGDLKGMRRCMRQLLDSGEFWDASTVAILVRGHVNAGDWRGAADVLNEAWSSQKVRPPVELGEPEPDPLVSAAAYNRLMAYHARRGEPGMVRRLMSEMDARKVVPDDDTYIHLINAHSVSGGDMAIWRAWRQCYRDQSRSRLTVEILDAMVEGLGRFGNYMPAQTFFNERYQEHGLEAGPRSWAGLLGAFGRSGRLGKAVTAWRMFKQRGGESTAGVMAAVVLAHAAGGEMDAAVKIWTRTLQQRPDWAATVSRGLLEGCSIGGNADVARRAMDEIARAGRRVDANDWGHLIDAVRWGAAHDYVRQNPPAYAVRGGPEYHPRAQQEAAVFAAKVFREMENERGLDPTARPYHVMIDVRGLALDVAGALSMMDEMRRAGVDFSVASYAPVIRALAARKDFMHARKLVTQMRTSGIEDSREVRDLQVWMDVEDRESQTELWIKGPAGRRGPRT
jgi:pentatricopeptide repeat protein